MSDISHDALWSKSKLLIGQALDARDEGADDDFQLKASLALELLAKAALAKLHPSLVANPTHFPSMLVACGLREGTDCHTINAKTLYARCKDLAPRLDKDACMAIAGRRNAYLHSGAMPYAGLDAERWLPVYWRAVDVLLEFQKKTLDGFVGPVEACRVRQVLEDAGKVLVTTVEARVEKCRLAFRRHYAGKLGAEVVESFSRSVRARPLAEDEGTAACPACGALAILTGSDELHWEPIEEPGEFDGESYLQWESVVVATDAFHCGCCGLEVRGYEELEAAGLPVDFEIERLKEREYVDEYMNE